MINTLIFIFSFEFSKDFMFSGKNIYKSYRYFPTETDIHCMDFKITNTLGVRIVSSRSNNVCVGNENGNGFRKNYNLGRYENYYVQYSDNIPYTNITQVVFQSNISFTKDVKIDEHRYKSYKYVPMITDIDCNSLFGIKNYTGIVVKANDGLYCEGSERGFDPNLNLEMFKTYEVEFDSRIRDEIYIQYTHTYLKCSDDCLIYRNNGYCEDGYDNSVSSACTYGTDCTDCGYRNNFPPPSPPPSLPPPSLPPPSPPMPSPPPHAPPLPPPSPLPSPPMPSPPPHTPPHTPPPHSPPLPPPPSQPLPLPPPFPPPFPPPLPHTCSNSCFLLSSDGICDDGGPGSEFSICQEGTDCEDCGIRKAPPQPPPVPSLPPFPPRSYPFPPPFPPPPFFPPPLPPPLHLQREFSFLDFRDKESLTNWTYEGCPESISYNDQPLNYTRLNEPITQNPYTGNMLHIIASCLPSFDECIVECFQFNRIYIPFTFIHGTKQIILKGIGNSLKGSNNLLKVGMEFTDAPNLFLFDSQYNYCWFESDLIPVGQVDVVINTTNPWKRNHPTCIFENSTLNIFGFITGAFSISYIEFVF